MLTPYDEGYETALIPKNDPFKECPYDVEDNRYNEWWQGYCKATIKMAEVERGEFLNLEH